MSSDAAITKPTRELDHSGMASYSRKRVLLVTSHPVQYAAPLYRLYSQDPRLEVEVAFCSLGASGTLVYDPGFGREVQWDVPLLDGYRWMAPRNLTGRSMPSGFWSLLNPGLVPHILHGGFDAVVVYGYAYASFWLAMAAASAAGSALLLETDAHTIKPRTATIAKTWLKSRVQPAIFHLADATLALSSGGRAYLRTLGIDDERIIVTPFVVDNDWWVAKAGGIDPDTVKASLGIPHSAAVLLFCGKLQSWKRPMDALLAFAMARLRNAYLVFVGDGPMRTRLERLASSLGLAECVRFVGFANQSQLPAFYRAADVLVVPSEYEPFGLVVNEAMLCGCPAIVSDQVGARFDLVRPEETGLVFPVGDVKAMAGAFHQVLSNKTVQTRLSRASIERMRSWHPEGNREAFVHAVNRAVQLHTRTRKDTLQRRRSGK